MEFFNFMSSMLHKLNNIRSLRALSREFSIDVLEEMLEKLRIVTEEKTYATAAGSSAAG
ncbi:DNA-binding protein stpA [Klebsiella pneumoniae IS53]|nr:DNA-binding protein stpA [Klebsiella pneumoniae IS53]CDL52884.1 DNA-binding protein stpA [Klebsiella pneumoniae ISC21]